MSASLLCLIREQHLLDISQLCGEVMAEYIIPLHVLTGCDPNSGFYGVGKKKVADRSEKSVEAQ